MNNFLIRLEHFGRINSLLIGVIRTDAPSSESKIVNFAPSGQQTVRGVPTVSAYVQGEAGGLVCSGKLCISSDTGADHLSERRRQLTSECLRNLFPPVSSCGGSVATFCTCFTTRIVGLLVLGSLTLQN
jgi:hypothetical protein